MSEERVIERRMRIILIAQLLKSLVLILLGCAAVVILSVVLYGLWQSATGLGIPLFLVAYAVALVVAYWLGWLPAVDQLRAIRRRGKR